MKVKAPEHQMTGTTCGSRPPQYQAACYRSKGQKVPQSALDAEEKAKPKRKLAPKLMKVEAPKHHMTGTTCGSRPPQYQAACYRSRGQKVPQSALDAEEKANPKHKLRRMVTFGQIMGCLGSGACAAAVGFACSTEGVVTVGAGCLAAGGALATFGCTDAIKSCVGKRRAT